MAAAFGAAVPGCGPGAGAEGGACYANGTCNEGLVCLSKTCVDPDGDSGGSGGSSSLNEALQQALAACFACGDAQCPDEAAACDSEPGCREALDCSIGCNGSTDPACASSCDLSGLTTSGVNAMQAFSICVGMTCANECVQGIIDAVQPGSGSGGGTGSGGDDGSGGDGSGGQPSSGGGSSGGAPSTGGVPGNTGGIPENTGGTINLGDELIWNGDFSSGTDFWSLDLNSGAGVYSTADDEICFATSTEENLAVSLGFPLDVGDAFSLEAGTTYTLSYQVRGNLIAQADLTEGESEAKIGLAEAPWTTIATYPLESWQSEYQYHSYVFTAQANYSPAGFVFNFSVPGADEFGGYSACFDNVSLRPHL